MAFKLSTASKNAGLNSTGIKEQFNLGFLYIYAGAVPTTADEALNMAATHTECVKISNNGTATGLTMDAPVGGVLKKAAAETWSGVVSMDGFQGAETTLTPTFYRYCTAADNGRGAANSSTGYRVQGTVGTTGSGADLELGSATLTDGFSQPIAQFEWELLGG